MTFFAVGGNFYFTGVEDVEDKRFFYTYENVFEDKPCRFPGMFAQEIMTIMKTSQEKLLIPMYLTAGSFQAFIIPRLLPSKVWDRFLYFLLS